MDALLCDECKTLIKPNEEFYSVTITAETYLINSSNIKEFDRDVSKYLHCDICNSCYSKLKDSFKIGLVD